VQAVSGIAHAAGRDAGDAAKPKLLPVSAIDYVSGYLMAYGVCVALARRRQQGGSWLVRVGLARVGKFIVDRGVLAGIGLARIARRAAAGGARAAARADALARRPHPLPEGRRSSCRRRRPSGAARR
jgi:crotonobetainyl-CoA:carnitine CoA-transferase CaiB-like acyl-CoA transferase